MAESKIAATERLRREGRWEEASAYREAERERFKAEGHKGAASEMAWTSMLERFTPLPVEELPSRPVGEAVEKMSDEDLDALLAKSGDGKPDFHADVMFAYWNLENYRAKPADAPSMGAWSVLQFARGNRNRFFEQVLPKALAKTHDEQEDDAPLDDLTEIRRHLHDAQQRWREEFWHNSPAEVKTAVVNSLDEWQRLCDVELSQGVRDELELAVACVVNKCLNASRLKPGQELPEYCS